MKIGGRSGFPIWVGAACLAGCLLDPRIAAAQVMTGSLRGVVSDQQGAIVEGALVRVSSPALIGGPKTETSNVQGEWRFPALSPASTSLRLKSQDS